LEAARRLGANVVLAADRPPGPSERGVVTAYYPYDQSSDEADWLALAAELDGHYPIVAVLGVAEQTVMPAALIRQQLGLPGNGPAVARRCTDKLIMKQAIRRARLACADFLDAGPQLDPKIAAARLGLPLVMKNRVGSGGRGRVIFTDHADLPLHFPAGTQIESFVTGLELSVESLVQAGRPIFTNLTEYFKPGWANILPADLPAETAATIQRFNAAAIQALGIKQGFTHLEIFLTERGIYFGELAARPPGGYIMELIEIAYGFDPWQAWLELELNRPPRLEPNADHRAGAWVLHPGPGQVVAIIGLDAARALKGVRRVSLRVDIGDELGERLGVGQEAGHILVHGPDRDSVAETMALAHQLVRIEIAQPELIPG
jgi:biotin carboxylase